MSGQKFRTDLKNIFMCSKKSEGTISFNGD